MTSITITTLKRLVIGAFLFLLPTQLGTFFFMDFSYIHGVRVDYLAPAIYLTDILFLVLCAFFWKHIITHIQRHIKPYSILFAFGLINISLSLYPVWALYSVLKICQIIFLYIIYASIRLKPSDVLIAFGLSAVLQLFLTLVQFGQKASVQGVFYYFGERYMSLSTPGIAKAAFFGEQILRPYGTFSHPNSLAGFFLLVYSFLLLLPSKSILKPVVLSLCAMLVLISFSKLAIFTFVLINIGYFIFHYTVSCRMCTIARFSLLLVVTGVFLQTHADPLTLEKRVWLFKQSLSIIWNNLLMGTGFGHHLFAHANFPDAYSYFFLQPVHNIFALFLMQAGILITCFSVFFLINHLKSNLSQIKKYGMYMLFVLALTGSGDHYWLTLQQNMLLVGTLWGLMIGQNRSAL
ncbi:O-antigen ligase family protein [Candidatus Woesebacteria bacterium]|nr:O-antigen ligase family protein [Candidatus Woesebacteria bacterium]